MEPSNQTVLWTRHLLNALSSYHFSCNNCSIFSIQMRSSFVDSLAFSFNKNLANLTPNREKGHLASKITNLLKYLWYGTVHWVRHLFNALSSYHFICTVTIAAYFPFKCNFHSLCYHKKTVSLLIRIHGVWQPTRKESICLERQQIYWNTHLLWIRDHSDSLNSQFSGISGQLHG